MRHLTGVIVAIAIVTPRVPMAQGGDARGMAPEDYFAFEFVRDPRLSPDGTLVAYVVTTVDRKQNRRHSDIWLASTDASRPPRPFVSAGASSTAPQWSHDGSQLAFLSSRVDAGDAPSVQPKPQVWALTLGAGDARPLTHLKNGVTGFQWSPDDARLVCVSRSGPSDEMTAGKDRSDVRHYRHSNYKFNDTGWFDDRHTHLWVVSLTDGSSQQITEGDAWDDTDPQWSPDGTHIAFVSDRTGRLPEFSRNTDIWVIPAAGGPLTKISDHEDADTSPRWAPDGRTIAFIGMTSPRTNPKIWVAPSTGRAASTAATRDFDLVPTDLHWSDHGRLLYFEVSVRGTEHVYKLDVASRHVSPVTSGERAVRQADVDERGREMVYVVNDPTHLDDVFVSDASGARERQVTHHNQALWAARQLAPVERLSFKGADDWDIDGFLMRPLSWTTGRSYPMILTIHGGPSGQYGVEWFHEFQVYAVRGYAVFFANPRGSSGYGERFERGIVNEWGGKAYIDIMNGVDAVLSKNAWIDPARIGVTGGSYGGYMTNWIVSHTTRFKAAVTLRAISNLVSDSGTRDQAYGQSPYFGGNLFDAFENYWNSSPLKYARDVKTPTLILHSDQDQRVPLEQAEQWFRALKYFGVTTELVIFPRENHNLTRTGEPRHLVESLNWQLYWFDRFLNGNAAATAPDAQ